MPPGHHGQQKTVRRSFLLTAVSGPPDTSRTLAAGDTRSCTQAKTGAWQEGDYRARLTLLEPSGQSNNDEWRTACASIHVDCDRSHREVPHFSAPA